MSRGFVAACVVCALVLVSAGSAWSQPGTVVFSRAFGVGVDTGGDGFENCTTFSGCQSGTVSGAAGGMGSPWGIAVDAQGRILVADQFNQRISRYVVTGGGTVAFDRAFGMDVDPSDGDTGDFENCTTITGCQTGTASGDAGGMNGPIGVAVDTQGRILVAESSNHRISRYVVLGDGSVVFDLAFGIGVDTGGGVFENCTTATGCQAGSPSGDAGGMRFPFGVAVDAAGRILVASQLNHRIERYVVAGDGTVSFDRAFGIDVDPSDGDTGDFENCTTASGCQAGTSSSAAGGMNAPTAVTVDAEGRILVVDQINHRIARYVVLGDGSVAFDRAFGMNVNPGGGSGFENCTTASGCQAGTPSSDAGGLFNPLGVTVDGEGRILVADQVNNRISRYVVLGDGSVAFDRAFGRDVNPGGDGEFENCTTATGCQSGAASSVAGAISSPPGVAVDGQGRIFVTESSTRSRVSVFGPAPPVPTVSTWGFALLALALTALGLQRMRRSVAPGR